MRRNQVLKYKQIKNKKDRGGKVIHEIGIAIVLNKALGKECK